MRRKLFSFLVMTLFVICSMTAAASDQTEIQEEMLPIYFFHNTACGTCDGTEEFRALVEEQISAYKDSCPYELLEYNVFQTKGNEAWNAITEEYSLENENYVFPVMVLDGKMYTGMSEIREQLQSAFFRATGISALYFYRKDCPECLEMEAFWGQIPETFKIEDQEFPCEVLKMESRTDNNGELIRQLFEDYQVPEEDQMVPIVFLKDSYLAGKQEIEEDLLTALENGSGFLSEGTVTGGAEDEIMVSESGKVLE